MEEEHEKEVRRVALLMMFCAIAGWVSILIGMVNPFIYALLNSDSQNYFELIQKLEYLLVNLGLVGCTAGYVLANEVKNWSVLGKLTLGLIIVYLIHGVLKSLSLIVLSDTILLFYSILIGLIVAGILLYFISTFFTKKVGFKFSYSLWGSISFGLELALLPFSDLPPAVLAVTGALFAVITGVFSAVVLRYSLRMMKNGSKPR